jgi:AAHS family 4-hydroxybenzoate transporter-like MFS transporter
MEATLIAPMLATGDTIGALALGQLMDRVDPHYVLGASYILSTVFIAFIGNSTTWAWLLVATLFGADLCLPVAQTGVDVWPALSRPRAARGEFRGRTRSGELDRWSDQW